MQLLTIAFEGFDGSGKDTAIGELSNLIDCETYETQIATKKLRQEWIRTHGDGPELHDFMLASYEKEWIEISERVAGLAPGAVLLINRSWVSYESVRFAKLGGELTWPDSYKPDLILSLRVQESLRVPRILGREGSVEALNERERQLMSDKKFRDKIIQAEMLMGCTPLRIRERTPSVVAMRVLQNLLARPGFTYVPRA